MIPLCALEEHQFVCASALCPKFPCTLTTLLKERQKDGSFCRVSKGHCYTCWARGNCLSSFCCEKNGLILI